MLATEQKTRREVALERALMALLKTAHPLKEVAADMLIGLIQIETERRTRDVLTNKQAADTWAPVAKNREARRRAWHVELVRMRLPREVVAALQGD